MRRFLQWLDITRTNETQLLLSGTIQRNWRWAATISPEVDDEDTVLRDAWSKHEEEEEARWFAELQQRPWQRRPSSYWLIPWITLCGINMRLFVSTVWRLRNEVICRDILSKTNDINIMALAGDSLSLAVSGGVNRLAPIDECSTPTMTGMVRQVVNRIETLTCISLLLTLAKWCSLSDIYGRKFLMHVGLAGTAVSIGLNWLAASQYNIFGHYLYYLVPISLAFLPAASILNPGIFAYCADCTPKDRRGVVTGYLVIGMTTGTMLGTSLDNYVGTVVNDRTVPLRISLILTALLAVYLSFVPESLRRKPASLTTRRNDNNSGQGSENATTPSLSTAWTIVAFLQEAASMILDPILNFLPGRIPTSSNMATSATPMLILLVHFFVCFGYSGAQSLVEPMTDLLFNWNTVDIDKYASFINKVVFVALFVLLPLWTTLYKTVVTTNTKATDHASTHHGWLQDRTNLPSPVRDLYGVDAIRMDLFFSIGGLFLLVISHLLIPLFPSFIMLYFAGAMMTVGLISSVSVISVLSSIVPNRLIGAAFGAHAIFQELATVCIGLTYEPLFARTMATSPLFYYYVSVGILALALFAQTINWVFYHLK